jgi:hypothetical protein
MHQKKRHKLSNDFYKQLQNIYNKINKNDYFLLLRDLNVRIGIKTVKQHEQVGSQQLTTMEEN